MKSKINNKINVVFYSEKWTSGGIEAFIMNICKNLDHDKININILTSQNETQIYDEEIKKIGGQKHVTLKRKYSSPILRTIKNFKGFKEEIKKMNCDILHLNICHGVAMIYAFLAKKAGIKNVIIHSHNSDIGKKNKLIKTLGHNICKAMFEKYGDKYLACSDLAAEWMYTKKTLNSGNVELINNAIDVSKFVFNDEERKKIRRKLKIEDKWVIGHIGRFNEQKNHEYLIEIFKEIHNREKNAVLLLIGEGELKSNIIEKVKELNLTDSVIFYGETKGVNKLLWAMDVFVLPSLFEGKPVVGIEVQAAALKSYISDTITKTVKISEYIEYLSIKESPKKWADEIIENGKKYERIDMKDIIIKNEYDIKAVAYKLQKKYIDMVKGDKYEKNSNSNRI